jgi:hypothetical protein
MALAPEPYLSACLETVRFAVLAARIHCWGESASHEQLADLMDAIHNLPSFVLNWENCHVERLRDELRAYDKKWAEGKSWLLDVFDRATEAERYP